MPEYPHGTPSWVDLTSPDPDASARFYKQLFGWEAEFRADPELTGGYRTFTLNGKSVGGLMPQQSEQQPIAWFTYISVDDADETMTKVKEAGGQVIVEPMDVMDLGRMAFFVDTTGAAFGIWQPRAHKGADIVNRTGALGWNELATRQPDKAKEFYSAVFGWEPQTTDMAGFDYTRWQLGERLVGGMVEMGDNWPDDVPSNWLAYFNVDDADATVATAQTGGGNVIEQPRDIPELGRFSVMSDPHGAVFAVIALLPKARERNERIAAEIGA